MHEDQNSLVWWKKEIIQSEGSRYMIASWSMGAKKSRPPFKTTVTFISRGPIGASVNVNNIVAYATTVQRLLTKTIHNLS